MSDNQLYEEYKMWPLKITLASKTGYTMWASSDGKVGTEEDMLLSISNLLVLFKSLETLGYFLNSEITLK
jgi:hypothetical protein